MHSSTVNLVAISWSWKKKNRRDKFQADFSERPRNLLIGEPQVFLEIVNPIISPIIVWEGLMIVC